MSVQKIEISTNIIWKTVLILIFLWFLFLIRDILLLLFLAIVVVSAAQPFVDALEKRKFPRAVSALILYAIFFFVIGWILYLIIPIISSEIKQFAENIPGYFKSADSVLQNVTALAANYNFEADLQRLIDNTTSKFADSLSGVFSNSLQFLAGLLKFIVVASLSFYMLVKRDGTRGFLQAMVPRKNQKYVIDLVGRIQKKIGRWLIGQATLIVIIFILDYIVLSILGVPFALIIALIGGMLEIIPYIGPTIAIVPAALAALTISPWAAVVVVLAYIAIQQLENHVITPLIMKKAVGLNPVVIILVLLIGGTLAGVPGVILAIPFATAADLFLSDLIDKKGII